MALGVGMAAVRHLVGAALSSSTSRWNTGSLVYCAIPMPRRNGRNPMSRSRVRQPSSVVSSVTTIASHPQRSARETRLSTSSFDVLQ